MQLDLWLDLTRVLPPVLTEDAAHRLDDDDLREAIRRRDVHLVVRLDARAVREVEVGGCSRLRGLAKRCRIRGVTLRLVSPPARVKGDAGAWWSLCRDLRASPEERPAAAAVQGLRRAA